MRWLPSWELVTQLKVAVAEVLGQFKNCEEGEHMRLEAVTSRLVKTQQTGKAEVCALVNCNVCRTVTALSLFVFTFCKSSINQITNTNSNYSHPHTCYNIQSTGGRKYDYQVQQLEIKCHT